MSMHPDPDVLAAIALDAAAAPDHVAQCPRCTADVSEFQGVAGRLRLLPAPPQGLLSKAVAYFERRRALDQLIARLAEDPILRVKLGRDPIAVIHEAGLEPTPELVEALRDIERGESGAAERLAARLWF